MEAIDLIGYFVTAAPLILKFKPEESPLRLLELIKKRMMETWTNRIPYFKFHEIPVSDEDKKHMNQEDALTVNFSLGFTDPINLPEIESEFVEVETLIDPGKGILLQIFASKKNLNYSFYYRSDCFKEQTIIKISERFESALNLVANFDQS